MPDLNVFFCGDPDLPRDSWERQVLAGNTRLAYSSATKVQVIYDGKYLLEPGRLVNIYLSNHRLNKLLMSIVIPRQ